MLAMDTATGVVGVALHDGSRLLAQEDVAGSRAHARVLHKAGLLSDPERAFTSITFGPAIA